jgi:hypothetical protein
MSGAFQLDFTGPQTRCDFPGCILESFHDGDHKPAEKSPVKWTYDRHCVVCGVPFTVLGADPKMIFETCGSQECLLHYARHHAPTLPVLCTCSQRPYPHELHVHNKQHERPGTYEVYQDGETVRVQWKQFPEGPRWPWSLRFAAEMEAK